MKTLFAICCVAVFSFAQTGAPLTGTHIAANRMTKTGEVVHLAGGIVIENDLMLLQADAADVNSTTGDITAHGDVHIHMKKPSGNSK
jgi:lipopolysaccharide assembly outer membrane protein LptD (OstA)